MSYLKEKIRQSSPEARRQRRVREIEQYYNQLAEDARREVRWASRITAGTLVGSVILVGLSFVLALFGQLKIGIATSVASALVAVAAKLVRPQYDRVKRDLDRLRQELRD